METVHGTVQLDKQFCTRFAKLDENEGRNYGQHSTEGPAVGGSKTDRHNSPCVERFNLFTYLGRKVVSKITQ